MYFHFRANGFHFLVHKLRVFVGETRCRSGRTRCSYRPRQTWRGREANGSIRLPSTAISFYFFIKKSVKKYCVRFRRIYQRNFIFTFNFFEKQFSFSSPRSSFFTCSDGLGSTWCTFRTHIQTAAGKTYC